ncbi:tail fiber protein [Aquimarina aquimarini]|uniref:tail fiber protein n=1 Tax=Aquimarina aquimarini TaxID=1191734 RepID=UPI001F23AC8B|nr:tail fiber protein [Aquimarina aquimarini]
MKNTLLSLGLISFVLFTNAQENKIDSTGNVGIGLTTPNAPLHIRKNQSGWLQEIAGTAPSQGDFVGVKVLSGYAGETSKWVGISAIAESLYSNKTGLGLYTGTSERLRITHNGNVGIGLTTPNAPLHIRKNQSGWLQEIAGTAPNQGDFVGVKVLSGYAGETSKWVGISAIAESLYSNKTGLGLYTGTSERLRITHNGNIGIGTTSPDMKLTVNGNIHAKEVKIDLNIPAPDYVFKEDYKLRSIEEVANFIKENSHLPEIPSAKEFEQNGVMQAEMDMSLLKKIEELTLYTIQQEKKIQKLEKQQKEISELRFLFEKLLESKK